MELNVFGLEVIVKPQNIQMLLQIIIEIIFNVINGYSIVFIIQYLEDIWIDLIHLFAHLLQIIVCTMYNNHEKCFAWNPYCTVVSSIQAEGCELKKTNCNEYIKKRNYQTNLSGQYCYWDDFEGKYKNEDNDKQKKIVNIFKIIVPSIHMNSIVQSLTNNNLVNGTITIRNVQTQNAQIIPLRRLKVNVQILGDFSSVNQRLIQMDLMDLVVIRDPQVLLQLQILQFVTQLQPHTMKDAIILILYVRLILIFMKSVYYLITVYLSQIVKVMHFVNYSIASACYNQVGQDAILLIVVQTYQRELEIMLLYNIIQSVTIIFRVEGTYIALINITLHSFVMAKRLNQDNYIVLIIPIIHALKKYYKMYQPFLRHLIISRKKQCQNYSSTYKYDTTLMKCVQIASCSQQYAEKQICNLSVAKSDVNQFYKCGFNSQTYIHVHQLLQLKFVMAGIIIVVQNFHKLCKLPSQHNCYFKLRLLINKRLILQIKLYQRARMLFQKLFRHQRINNLYIQLLENLIIILLA
ncbi:unnamed protein product [Paramecium sonneborni]|uniref:Transmembrane protein n=1 Tax=Paramecium sonneborni TaxID=65129 RepID=A0A8S1RNU9_9CILI|nr:unnamed protein product [Paramecium sonneborni]